MPTLSAISPSGLFAYTGSQSGQMEGLAQRAVTRGVDLFIEKRFDEAIGEFRRGIALAPNSTLAVDAYNQIAQAYTQQNDSDNAIAAYQQSLRLDPTRADTRIALGNLYYFEKRYPEALREYEQAVRLDPSAPNRFSLGQAYLWPAAITASARPMPPRAAMTTPSRPSRTPSTSSATSGTPMWKRATPWSTRVAWTKRRPWSAP
jgi:tetratricopeptide (TPR) repeat protein